MYFDDSNKTYLILDIEGNAVAKEEERKITQFAAILIKNNQKTYLSWYNRNVNLINPYVVKMTKISINKCKNIGYSEKHLINKIHELLLGCDAIYAYGCDFDRFILHKMFTKYHLDDQKIFLNDVILDVKKYLCPSKYKLEIASLEYGFNENSFHNALTDCLATLHLMKTIENMKGL